MVCFDLFKGSLDEKFWRSREIVDAQFSYTQQVIPEETVTSLTKSLAIYIYIYIHTYIYIYIYTYIHGNPQKDRKVFPMISTSCFQISHVSIALETPGGAPDGSLNFSFTETAKAVFDQGEWRDGDVYICMYVM